jgi:hypothetical protein
MYYTTMHHTNLWKTYIYFQDSVIMDGGVCQAESEAQKKIVFTGNLDYDYGVGENGYQPSSTLTR